MKFEEKKMSASQKFYFDANNMSSRKNSRYLEVPWKNDVCLGSVINGIIKQIVFQRDQMPMPFDILDCHIRSGRMNSIHSRLSDMHGQLRDLFQTLEDAFTNSEIHVDQVLLVLGKNRFNIDELHCVNLPTLEFPGDESIFGDVNALLRYIVEQDPFQNLPSGNPSSIQVFLHGSRAQPGDMILNNFEPLLRYSPCVTKDCPQIVFNVKREVVEKARPSTFRRSGSHFVLCKRQCPRFSSDELEGTARRLFTDDDDEDETELQVKLTEKSEPDAMKLKNNSVALQCQETSVANCVMLESKGKTFADSDYIWYRAKTAISGWLPAFPKG